MKKTILVLISLSLLALVGCDNNKNAAALTQPQASPKVTDDGDKCKHVEVKLGAVKEPFSITFNKELKLNKNRKNENYNFYFQAGREFGCVIWAVKQTNGVLKGQYVATEMERQNATCEGKQDYIFTQFVDSQGRGTFRLMCDLPVYEDQLPEPFAPKYEDVKKLNFSKDGDPSFAVIKREG